MTPAEIQPPQRVQALVKGKFGEVDPSEVEFSLPSSNRLFSLNANLIPGKSTVHDTRVFYGARIYNQALPLVDPEAAFVQELDIESKDSSTYDHLAGIYAGSTPSPFNGEVLDVTSSEIKLRGDDGTETVIPVYDLPTNRKTRFIQSALVKPGQRVMAGQRLTRSNFTDEMGNLALGKNAKAALVPYKGFTLDDSMAVSSGFAKRLTSHHYDEYNLDVDPDTQIGLDHYRSIFPSKFTKEQLERIDQNGIVKPGQTVQPGDPLILATRPRIVSSKAAQTGKVTSALRSSKLDNSIIWESHVPGVVTDVVEAKGKVKVYVESFRPLRRGDKISLRSGQKGVVSKVIDDEIMPRDEDGQILDILLNPEGVQSRINDNEIYELVLGKIAEKTGQTQKIPGFTSTQQNFYDLVKELKDSAGVRTEQQLYDPEDDSVIPAVTVGNVYVLKLHHTADDKLSFRGQAAYDMNEQPLKGSSASAQAKRFSGLETHASMAAGLYKFIEEKNILSGQKNDEYWRAYKMGLNPPKPQTPFVWHKFNALLNGAGFDAITDRDDAGKKVLRLGPLTSRVLRDKKPFQIQTADLVTADSLRPIEGGLFDPVLIQGNKWGEVKLPFKVVNPVFESAVQDLLGLTKKEFEDLSTKYA